MADAAEKKVPRNKWEENPDFGMKYDADDHHVRVTFNGETVAESTSAKVLLEPNHDPVFYVPLEDVRQELLARTDNHSHCPWKGHCSYFSVTVGGAVSENAMWTYEDPYPQAGFLKGYASFYPDRVDSFGPA